MSFLKKYHALFSTEIEFIGQILFAPTIIFSLVLFSLSAHAKVLDIQHWKTQKGTPVYFVPTKEIPICVIQIAFDGGSARDEKLPGIARLVNTLMNKGNDGLTADQLAEGFENIGAEYNHWVDRDMTVFQLKTITENKQLDTAVNYFSKIFKPDFSQKAFDQGKNTQIMAISQSEESPNTVADKTLLKAIYGDYPYGNPILGSKKSVHNIQLSNIKTFYQNYYTAKNAVISIAGAIDEKTAKALAEKVTRALSEGKKAVALSEPTSSTKATKINIPYASSQTVIRLGQLGISRHDPNYFPLLIGNYTLGGGMLVSRLSDEIREKRGLSYNVVSGFNPMAEKGPFIIALATRTEKAPEALKVTQNTLKRFLAEGPTDAELVAAKRFMKGNFPLRFETNTDIAQVLLNMNFYHLPLDYLDTYLAKIDGVTKEQIKLAFQKHVHMDTMAIVTVGKKS